MPVRSITLKLIVPRQAGQRAAAKALWTTHAVVNTATKYYETVLLEMRGQEYQTVAGEVSTEQVGEALLRRAQQAQDRNGRPDRPGDHGEICGLLHELYTHIVPSAVGRASDGKDITKVGVHKSSVEPTQAVPTHAHAYSVHNGSPV